ncbi:MAG: N-acetylmuramoyl-L-alanine amidase, partial [Clostridia bacterium]|nr:N-acetylmuramoyl-L-alanine amidase [Clostridia bacterium]
RAALAAREARVGVKSPVAYISIPAAAIPLAQAGQQLRAREGDVNIVISLKYDAGQAVLDRVGQRKDLRPLGGVITTGLAVQAGPRAVAVNLPGEGKASLEIPLAEDSLQRAGDPRKINAYCSDPAGEEWVYTRTKVDLANRRAILPEGGVNTSFTLMAYTPVFEDLRGHWAQGDIEYMAAKYLAQGTAAATFNPDGEITRAEFTTMLARALNIKDYPGGEGGFSDVPPGAWYGGSMTAAFRAGLVEGVGAGRFAPAAPVTREEMAALLVRALERLGYEVHLDQGEAVAIVGRYADQGQIHAWAREDMAKAIKAGLLEGTGAGTIQPGAGANRAQGTVAIKRLLEKVELI